MIATMASLAVAQTVWVQPLSAGGDRQSSELAGVRVGAEAALTACLEAGGPSPDATFRLTIDRDGQVVEAARLASPADPDSPHLRCYEGALRGLRFAPGGSGSIDLSVTPAPTPVGIGSLRTRASATAAGTVPPPSFEALVRAFVLGRSPELRECWDPVASEVPAGGSLRVRFTIAGDGAVTEAVVEEDGVGSAELSACLVARIGAWRLPAPPDGATKTIRYPLRFGPG